MNCKLCQSDNVEVVWDAPIRNGGLGSFTQEPIKMYRCNSCGVIWHTPLVTDLDDYYSSNTYRDSVDGNHSMEAFHTAHDYEVLNRLEYTGTEIFRNKSVADVGCAAGTFLDYISGVASAVVAIEPSEYYRDHLTQKGYEVYKYCDNCLKERTEKLDVVVSFSVIEHVEDPYSFLKDIYNLLTKEGRAIIGTPSDAPLMRYMIGDGVYEREVLYSVQHLYVFNAGSLETACKSIGFKSVSVKTFQRYGLDNLLGWLKCKKARINVGREFCEGTINSVFKAKVMEQGLGDYLVVFLEK